MTEHLEPDDDETAVRTALLRLGVRPAGHATDDDSKGEQQPAPPAVQVPPMPDYEPAVMVPGPRRGSAPRLPDWWKARKPALDEPAPPPGDDAEDGEDQGEKPALAEHGDDEAEDDQAAEQPARRRGPRLRKVEKRPDSDDADDLGEEDEEEPADGDEDAGERQPAKRARRWRRSPAGSVRPPFTAPGIPLYTQPERKSLAEAIREIPPHLKWIAYTSSGFATGWYFGIPQFVTAATASIAQHPGRIQDNPDAYFFGALALAVLLANRATRRSWWLLVWVTHGLTWCLIIGTLLYGNHATH
ncbi:MULTISPECIES: hypothetical protein [Streptomyces]|uniref:Uncharacterized protein n=1 Tax=Streptomyces sp. 900129855 TaxID=3155129 RepID=A0ABV2ZRP9_9ACTN